MPNDFYQMFETSYQDYQQYKASSNLSKLRDASNKLFAVMRGYIESKIGRGLENQNDFIHKYYSTKISDLDYERKKRLFRDLMTLHIFFYHGLQEEQSASDMEDLYLTTIRLISRIINRKVG